MSAATVAASAEPSKNRRRLARVAPWFFVLCSFWLSWCDGRVPTFLSRSAERTLYFKLPIAGTRFHWKFADRGAFLAGELTLRIANRRRGRDTTLLIFRHGVIHDDWQMIGSVPRDSSFYFGFSTDVRFPTAPDDSVIVTLTAVRDLEGRGPYTAGTLPAGRWVATGTYSGLYGGTWNPLNNLARFGEAPIAFMACWDTVWGLTDTREEGWMGPKPADEDQVSVFERLKPQRGVDGRRCGSRL